MKGVVEPEILYEDNHLLAVNKPPDLLSQGDRSGELTLLDLLKGFIKKRDNKPGKVYLGLVHRLDRPVSGVILLAKTSKAAGRLSEQIRQQRFSKCYVAVTELPASKSRTETSDNAWQEHRHALVREKRKTVVARNPANRAAKQAVLHLKSIATTPTHRCHLVRLITGRKHQIRAQLEHLGMPICGDEKYGSRLGWDSHGIGLHALQLSLTHPVSRKPITFLAMPDPAFLRPCFGDSTQTLLNTLRQEAQGV